MHLVLTNDPAKAREQQHEAFLKVMSNERGPAYLESVYLFGTPDEIVASLQARVDAGVEYFFLHTMTPDPAQLQNWIDYIIPNVKFPDNGRAGPPNGRGMAVLACRVTQRVALIGKPLKRRHSVVMHNAAFDAAGIDGRYELMEIDEDATSPDAVDAAHGPDWLGLGVTAPYKQARRRRSSTRSSLTRARSARSTTSSARQTAGWSASTRDAPGFRAGVELAMGRPLAGAAGRGRRRRWCRAARSSTRSSRPASLG